MESTQQGARKAPPLPPPSVSPRCRYIGRGKDEPPNAGNVPAARPPHAGTYVGHTGIGRLYPVRDALHGRAQLPDGPVGGAPFGDVVGLGVQNLCPIQNHKRFSRFKYFPDRLLVAVKIEIKVLGVDFPIGAVGPDRIDRPVQRI